MICDIEDLGTFSSCEEINFPTITNPVLLVCLETKRRCVYPNGDFGQLAPGNYIFDYDENLTQYTFQVLQNG